MSGSLGQLIQPQAHLNVAQATHDALAHVRFITLANFFAGVFYFFGYYYFWGTLWRVLRGD